MGVDITTYRIRIGSFFHSKGTSVSAVKSPLKLSSVLHAVGTVAFIGILLVISGIEQNPGPILIETWIILAALAVLLVGICIIYWTTCTCLLLVFVALFLLSKSRQRRKDEEREVKTKQDDADKISAEKSFSSRQNDVKKTVELLTKLHLVNKYPEKIHMRNLISVSVEDHKDENLTLADLPWIFLSKIMCMNNNAMDLPRMHSNPDSAVELNSVSDLYESCQGTSVDESISPLDLFILVLQCCDPMLKQIIFSRLFLCKLAIPFLYKNVDDQPSMYIWPLRSILIGMKQDSVLHLNVNIVSFARFGRPQISKSNLLNNILRSEDTFFHRNSPSGTYTRYLTQGYVEMFFLPLVGDSMFNFERSITFFNMRGDIELYDKNVISFISKLSDTITIFSDIKSILKKDKSLHETIVQFQNVILVIASPLDKNDGTSEQLFQFVSNIRDKTKTKLQIICTYKNKMEQSRTDLVDEISLNISKQLQNETNQEPLSVRLSKCSKYVPKSDENNECNDAKKAASSVMDEMKKESVGHEILSKVITPVQTLSFDISELLKQMYKCDNGLDKVEDIKTEIKEIREKQLLKMSKSILLFIGKLRTYRKNPSTLFYFLGWLQYFLEQKKRLVLPKLMQENKAAWDRYRNEKTKENITSDKLNEYEKKIKDIENKIEKASFGLNHLFREMGQICDTIINLGDDTKKIKQFPHVAELSEIAASLVCNGFTLELLDGNSFYMPIKWVKLVLSKINEQIGNTRVMTLSVLGVQSSGKSTLLNTMFGLQLPASAGRCTRGIHAHLLPIKHTENKLFQFAMVLDTEGLRAPELSDRNFERDNKLATIITGLGDITLFNIMGENSVEMKDILQIIIHALIRLQLANKNLRMLKSCAFIHQNVTDITASDKLKTSIQLLVRNLDTATKESAETELISDITTFSQIIEFDTENCVWYLPNLWLGNPPMARVNKKYSEKVLSIRSYLFGRALCAMKKSYKTLNEIVVLTEDLWKGVLSEDFVFSFRNSLEKKAYTELEEKMRKEKWSIDDSVDDEVYQLASNACSQCDNRECLGISKTKVVLAMEIKVGLAKDVALKNIDIFFKNNKFTEITIQWKEQSLNSIRFYSNEVIEKKKMEIEHIFNKREVDIMITVRHAVLEEELMNKSIELARELKGKDIDKNESEQRFEQIWKKFVNESLSASALSKTHLSMQDIFVRCLLEHFRQHPVLREELTKRNMLNEDLQLNCLSGSFSKTGIEKTDMNIKKKIIKFMNKIPLVNKLAPKDPLQMTVDTCEQIFGMLDKKIVSICQNDKEITTREVKKFLKCVYEFFENFKEILGQDKTVKISFIIKAIVHISSFACSKFEDENRRYQVSKGIHARLATYKSQVQIIFNDYLEDRKDEETAAALLRDALAKHIEDTISFSMSMKVKRHLRGKLPMLKHLLILDILKKLVSEQSFESFLKYINFPREYGYQWISELAETLLFSPMNKCYYDIAEKEITLCFEDIYSSFSKVAYQLSNSVLSIDTWKERFTLHLEKYTFPKECFRNIIGKKGRYAKLNSKHFEKNLLKEFDDLKNALLREFESKTQANVRWKGENPIDKLCDEIWGCKEHCIFCGEPCIRSDIHKGTTHSCFQHRPKGCRGVHYKGSNKISITSCNYDVASNETGTCAMYKFLCNPGHNCECNQEMHPFKDYKMFLPDWDIEPTTDMEDRSKFWMWFIAQYKEDIATHFNIDVSPVPPSWDRISSEEAIASLSMLYSRPDDPK